MKYTIKAKPTKYNGRLYRSRLEARWAVYFDLNDIDFEYEPFDLEGWSPDFLINGDTVVEVKPVDIYYKFNSIYKVGDCRELLLFTENTFTKIANHFLSEKKFPRLIPRDYGCLLLGIKNHGYYFKNYRSKVDNNLFQTELDWFIKMMHVREENKIDPLINHRYDNYYIGISEIMEFDNKKWQEAGNRVQFLKPN